MSAALTRDELVALALSNPQLCALYLLSGKRKAWKSFTIPLTFPSGVLGTTVEGELTANIIACDFIVRCISHEIQAPNSLAGSAFFSQNATYTTKSPYTNVSIQIKGCDDRWLTDGPGKQPIGMVSRPDTEGLGGYQEPWLLEWDESIRVTAALARTLNDDENPYTLIVGFQGWYIRGSQRCGGISLQDAIEICVKYKLLSL